MKLRLLTTITLLATVGFAPLVKAQNLESAQSVTPSTQSPVSGDRVLQACAKDQADTLPNPFSDVSPRDWAFKAVMSMYYCGAYRGSSAPEQVKPFLQPQPSETSGVLRP